MDCVNFSFEGENLCDISWAKKNYSCSFCKREFKSAQALGGHMNVHRRDRARLRLLPSSLISSENPNPNSYFSSSFSSSSSSPSSSSLSPSAKAYLPHKYSSCHSFLSPSLRTLGSTPSSASSGDENKKPKFDYCPQNDVPLIPKKGLRGVVDHEARELLLKGFAQKDLDDDDLNKVNLTKERDITWLDLDLDMGFFKDHKEEVDLELRLGHL